MAKAMKREQDMTPSERAQLVAQRVGERKQREKEEAEKTRKPSVMKRLRSMVPSSEKRKPGPNVRESLSKEDQIADIEEEKKVTKAEKEAARLDTVGFKNGGMVTARGQGKVLRSRKTRIC
jgi:hypothetical protein